MKVTIEDEGQVTVFEIPSWALERRLLLLAGVELVAAKEPWGHWEVKATRCQRCGQCCMTYPDSPWGVDEEGKCLMLEKQPDGTWDCKAGTQKPYLCLGDPLKKNTPECSITREVIEPK